MWFIFVEMFDSIDLLGHVNGTSPPSVASNEKLVTDWLATDCRARWIEICVEIRTMRISQEMWDYLHGRYL